MRDSIKKTLAISGFLLLASLLATEVVFAATDFVPLAPLPGTTQGCSGSGGQCITPATYLPGIFKLGIGIVSALAVLSIAYGGIKYMTSDVVTSKSDSIQLIKNSMLGLLLALGSYLILYTINPDLVTTDFNDIPQANPLPAPVNVSTPVGYRATFYAAQYSFSYQEYECEIFWSVPGNATTQKERYATDCSVQFADKKKWLTDTYGSSAPPIGMRKTEAYENFESATGYGNVFTSATAYAILPERTLRSGELSVCQSDMTSVTTRNPYRNVITETCQKTQSGTPTTNNYTTLQNCKDDMATKPNAVITQNCVPVYNTTQ